MGPRAFVVVGLLIGCGPKTIAPAPPPTTSTVSSGEVVIGMIEDDGTRIDSLPPVDLLQACHDHGRKRDPAHAGWMFVHVRVGEGGEVLTAADVRTGGLPKSTTDCLLVAVKKTLWPPPDGGSLLGTMYIGLR